MAHHLLVRDIPAVIEHSTTLSAVIGSAPIPTQHHTYWTGADGHVTLGADTIPGPPPTPTSLIAKHSPSHPKAETASPTTTPVILDSPYIAEVSDLANAGRELRRDATGSGSSANSSSAPSGTTASATPTFSAACVDPAVCCITADQCKQNSGPYTATSTRNEAGHINEQSLAWPVMAVAGVLMALGF